MVHPKVSEGEAATTDAVAMNGHWKRIMARGKSIERASVHVPAGWHQALALNLPLPERAGGITLFADIFRSTPLTEAPKQAPGLRRGAKAVPNPYNQVKGIAMALVLCERTNRTGPGPVGSAEPESVVRAPAACARPVHGTMAWEGLTGV